jgi:nuclear RNA export factor
MSTPRGGRGRGRGRGRGGQNFFQQQQADGDMQMNDTREYVPRGRGRGGQPFQSKPQYHNDGDQSMRDQNQNHFNPRGRGRGRGRGQHFQQDQNSAQSHLSDAERAQAQSETVALLEGFLGRRYDPNTKLLDLSSIAADEEVLKSGMFDSEKTQKKFFPALMIVCDEMLPSRAQKIEAIDSVSLANNNVPNLNVIYDLVKSLNHIKNLDLSGNAFASLGPLKPWKNRFKSLEHLIINPFPEPNWKDELIDWFPRLRILNGKQVRPDTNTQQQTPAAAANVAPTQCAPNAIPAATPPAITPEEQQKKEEMILFVQQATNLNRDYAIQCLEAGQWDLQQASDLFAQSRQTLPPNAFIV